MRSLIDIVDFTVEELQQLLDTACDIIENPDKYAESCKRKKLATLFYEPSTRTRLSFEAAMLELGGSVIGFSEASSSSASKGESISDTAKMISCYADIMAMRHPKEGAPYVASKAATIPVINAGDGSHCHPTQTLADLLTIYREIGRLDNLVIGCCGDLKYGRTVHSLLMALSHFKVKFQFVACEELRMPEEFRTFCDKNGIEYTEHTDFSADVINSSDILYMTRVQRERFTDLMEYERVKDLYNLHNAMLADSKPNLRILHPLPRVNEISQDVDDNPKAYYFQQAQNGLYARQAMICKVLGIKVNN